MPFESVYRVSRRNALPTKEDVVSLGRELGMELPVGYQDYITTFGAGTLSYILMVRTPDEIRNPTDRDRTFYREMIAYAAKECASNTDQIDLSPSDIERGTFFARESAEAGLWFAVPSQGTRLFEFISGDIFEIENGFYGLVDRETEGQQHEFPFFEPRNGRRRMRQLYVRPGIGRNGLVQAMVKRWGQDSVRCSRTGEDELDPHYFVSPIEAHLDVQLEQSSQLPQGAFFVRAHYSIDSEADFANWVEPLLLPGGGPHECVQDNSW